MVIRQNNATKTWISVPRAKRLQAGRDLIEILRVKVPGRHCCATSAESSVIISVIVPNIRTKIKKGWVIGRLLESDQPIKLEVNVVRQQSRMSIGDFCKQIHVVVNREIIRDLEGILLLNRDICVLWRHTWIRTVVHRSH